MATIKPGQQKIQSGTEFTGRHMAFVMVGFFSVIILVNLTMAYFATHSWSGLVVKNGYIASQRFNLERAQQVTLLENGWQGLLDYKDELFLFQLQRDKAKMANDNMAPGESDCTVTGLLSRPVHEHSDVFLSFKLEGDGKYSTPHHLTQGNWELRLKAVCPAMLNEFIQHYRFVKSAKS